mmetsp:Transcript_11641/g.38289  ORF Transcript_11641/g.38289 Transcript_11641/m.38289 type:complete len:248 (+) Transcript_11641:270-1013(+)
MQARVGAHLVFDTAAAQGGRALHDAPSAPLVGTRNQDARARALAGWPRARAPSQPRALLPRSAAAPAARAQTRDGSLRERGGYGDWSPPRRRAQPRGCAATHNHLPAALGRTRAQRRHARRILRLFCRAVVSPSARNVAPRRSVGARDQHYRRGADPARRADAALEGGGAEARQGGGRTRQARQRIRPRVRAARQGGGEGARGGGGRGRRRRTEPRRHRQASQPLPFVLRRPNLSPSLCRGGDRCSL